MPAGFSGIENNADGVTLDLNGISINGLGVFQNGAFSAITTTNHQRMAVLNGSVAGFVQALGFLGDARFIRLERMQVDANTRTSAGGQAGGLAAAIGVNRARHAVVDGLQAIGQIQMTCPGLVRNSVASIVETNVPPNGTGVNFPTNGRGDQAIAGPFN